MSETEKPRAEDGGDRFSGDPDALFSERAAADFLGYSKRTLQGWRRTPGRGPEYSKPGGRVRYRRAALVAFVTLQEKLEAEKRSQRAMKPPQPASSRRRKAMKCR